MKRCLRRTLPLVWIVNAIALLLADASAEPLGPVDHIILGVDDLDRGIEQFELLTGVRPVYGGKHQTGTHNALVSLGGRIYLEILAVQPGASAPPDFLDLPGLKKLTPVGWAVNVKDSSSMEQRVAAAGVQITQPKAGSRKNHQGAELKWVTFDLKQAIDAGPLFVWWDPASPHPSATSPTGCKLSSWSVAGPESRILNGLRSLTDASVKITVAPATAMSLVLDCPKGSAKFVFNSAQQSALAQ